MQMLDLTLEVKAILHQLLITISQTLMDDPRAQTVGNFRQSSVVPLTQIRRIQQRCFGTEQNFALIEKMELHARSQERVKRWPNTLQALRKKKDETRFERFKADEEERRRVEIEEAAYQAQVKKEILEQANRQIYENQDRVRAFQGKLLLTDVIQEREAQLELKAYKGEIECLREKAHFEELLNDIEQGKKEEELKAEERRRKKEEQKKVLKEQHEAMVNNAIKNIQNEKIEGELIKAKALALIREEEEAAMERKRKRLQNLEEVKRGNEEIKEQKRLQAIKEAEEDERIRAYAEKKEQIMEMRRRREELKFREKQEQRQKLIDTQISRLQEQQEQKERILNKQIREAELKAEEVERVKKEKREQLVQRINWSRQITTEFKTRAQKETAENDKEFRDYWQRRNLELKKQEEDENAEIRRRNMQLKEFHVKQMDEKQKLREQAILQDLTEQEDILRKQENQNRTFTSWAERAIKEWSDNGKNVYPLIKELNQKS